MTYRIAPGRREQLLAQDLVDVQMLQVLEQRWNVVMTRFIDANRFNRHDERFVLGFVLAHNRDPHGSKLAEIGQNLAKLRRFVLNLSIFKVDTLVEN